LGSNAQPKLVVVFKIHVVAVAASISDSAFYWITTFLMRCRSS